MNPYLIAAIIAITSATTWQICEWRHDSEKVGEAVGRIEIKQKQVEVAGLVVEKTIKNVNKLAPKLREIHEKIIRVKTNNCILDAVTTSLLISATSSRLSKTASLPAPANAGSYTVSCKTFAGWAVKQIEKYEKAREINKGVIEWDEKLHKKRGTYELD